jgi:hypothetical protein
MFCPKCGFQLVSETAPFCTQCGAPVKASAEAPVQVAGITSAQVAVAALGKRSTRRRALWVGILVGVGILGLALLGVNSGGIGEALGDASVTAVKNGTLPAPHNTTTVGKAFEGTFHKPHWTVGTTNKGETFVEFTGTATYKELMDGFGRNAPADNQSAMEALALIQSWPNVMLQSCPDKVKAYQQAMKQADNDPQVSQQYRSTNNPKFGPQYVKDAAAVADTCELPVKFQFMMMADDKTKFRLTYVDEHVFLSRIEPALNFIYQ